MSPQASPDTAAAESRTGPLQDGPVLVVKATEMSGTHVLLSMKSDACDGSGRGGDVVVDPRVG